MGIRSNSPLPLHYTEHGLCNRRQKHKRPTDSSSASGPLHSRHMNRTTTDDTDVHNGGTIAAMDPSQSPPAAAAATFISVLGIPIRTVILLNIVAIIWGSQHSIIKSVVSNNDRRPIWTWANPNQHVVFGTYIWELLTSKLKYFTNSDASFVDNGVASAAYFTLARFSLAALFALPFTLLGQKGRSSYVTTDRGNNDASESRSTRAIKLDDKSAQIQKQTKRTLRYGIELGIYMFLGYAFQAIGLQTTTASRSGFLLYLNVKLVPFFSYFIFGKTIQRNALVSALIAFSGTALLALDNNAVSAPVAGGNGFDVSFTVGDLWSIAAAAASALFILRMEAASKAIQNSAQLSSVNLWTVALLSLFWSVWVSSNDLHPTIKLNTLSETLSYAFLQTCQRTVYTITTKPIEIIYLSAVTTALANYLQSIAQKKVSAERASIFYALDPVWGAVFANLLLGEKLGVLGWVGSSLIVFAAATNAV
ncbi:hypothetical protein ACHAWC_011372 [Mediolabrus comicus]